MDTLDHFVFYMHGGSAAAIFRNPPAYRYRPAEPPGTGDRLDCAQATSVEVESIDVAPDAPKYKHLDPSSAPGRHGARASRACSIFANSLRVRTCAHRVDRCPGDESDSIPYRTVAVGFASGLRQRGVAATTRLKRRIGQEDADISDAQAKHAASSAAACARRSGAPRRHSGQGRAPGLPGHGDPVRSALVDHSIGTPCANIPFLSKAPGGSRSLAP